MELGGASRRARSATLGMDRFVAPGAERLGAPDALVLPAPARQPLLAEPPSMARPAESGVAFDVELEGEGTSHTSNSFSPRDSGSLSS